MEIYTLNSRVQLWGRVLDKNIIGEDDYGCVLDKNIIGEDDYGYVLLKNLWALVVPENGRVNDFQGNTIRAEISHKFIVRSKSVPKLTNDMYFIFNDQRYDIKFFYPNYKKRDCVNIFCNLEVE